MNEPKIYRTWSMPNSDTFDIPPIEKFVKKYLLKSSISVDPFARNNCWTTYTNDLNPETNAEFHWDAEDFLKMLFINGVKCDLVILDPPYSPRQISECYRQIGKKVTKESTQNARLLYRVRNAADQILQDEGIVLSFGWNSSGMGVNRKFKIIEIMLCCHGSCHNDTICMSEKRIR